MRIVRLKPNRKKRTDQVSFLTCHVSHVTRHVAPVTCHLSSVTNANSHRPSHRPSPGLLKIFKNHQTKLWYGRPILAIHPSTRGLQSPRKWLFSDGTDTHTDNRRIFTMIFKDFFYLRLKVVQRLDINLKYLGVNLVFR